MQLGELLRVECFMCLLFVQATSRAAVTPEVRAHLSFSEWLVRNRYGFPIIGLAFYYTGFALVSLIVEGEFFRVVLLSIPLLVGLSVRRGFIVVPGAVLTLFWSQYYNLPFGIIDHIDGFGWWLAGIYITVSSFLFILTLIAWFISNERVTAKKS